MDKHACSLALFALALFSCSSPAAQVQSPAAQAGAGTMMVPPSLAGRAAPDAGAPLAAGSGGAGRASAAAAGARAPAANGGGGAAGLAASAGAGAAGKPGVSAAGSGGGAAGMVASAAGMGGATGQAGMPAAGSGACPMPMPGSKGKNPLFSDQYTADPGALVDGCTFYIHCGHDEGPTSFVLREWFALASTDMVHWTKQVALKLSDFQWADANAWAGQVVRKGDKYYWFAPVQERGGGMAIGVAVGDSPMGPFKDLIGKPLINDDFEMSNVGFRTPSDTPYTIDPSVFVDDDGRAYLHYGGFSRMMVAKLTPDMKGIDGKMKEVTPQGFFEAAYLIKHDGKYYEIYAAGQNPATIDYSTSDSPLGPWKYGGRVLDALPGVPGQDAPTNHAAVAELTGQWYIVYHVSNGPNGGGTYKREVAVDKLTFKADGSIGKVTPSAGLMF